MPDRRTTNRRKSVNTPEEQISRQRERREADRRDSPRLPMRFLVREHGDETAWEEREGDLSLGGIHWLATHPPRAEQVEVRFRLPSVPREIRAHAEIIRLSEAGKALGFHVRFTELDVESELAIARYIDDQIATRSRRDS